MTTVCKSSTYLGFHTRVVKVSQPFPEAWVFLKPGSSNWFPLWFSKITDYTRSLASGFTPLLIDIKSRERTAVPQVSITS